MIRRINKFYNRKGEGTVGALLCGHANGQDAGPHGTADDTPRY